jgi:hypothetical protein
MIKIVIMLFSSIIYSQSEFLDIDFYDASGKTFHSLKLKTEIDSLFRMNSNPFVFVSVTNSSNNIEYRKQIEYLKEINAEELQLLFVDSNTDTTYNFGYYTDTSTASKLLEDGYNFKFILLDGKGKVVYDSTRALTAKEIIDLVEQ